MFDRFLAFLKDLPARAEAGGSDADDPRIAAAALMYHVMDADGVRQDVEWERMKALLAESYSLSGDALDRLVAAGAAADQDSVDLYAFTSVLKRHLNEDARTEFIRLMWEIVFADGVLHELEDHTLWRIAELIGVDRSHRLAARREAQSHAPAVTGRSAEDD